MRRLHRPAVSLPTLTSGAGAKKAAKHAEAREIDPEADLDFPAYWNDPDVRGALYAMHGRVCAFCLSALTRGDRGDVEHFRPKSLYFWLAYIFGNYLLSCSACNRIFKREHFPIAPGEPRTTHQDRDSVAKEARLFLDPAADPVEQWLVIKKDDPRLRWIPEEALQEGSLEQARATETIQWFHLNDDPELMRDRADAIDEALYLLFERKDREEARRRASRFRPHGAAVRSLLAAHDKDALPTVDEETGWLLEELWQDWQWAEKIGGEISEKRLRELEWAFAVLWKAPPPGSNIDMAAWLTNAGVRVRVERRYREL